MRRVICSTTLAVVATLTSVVLTAPTSAAAGDEYVALGDSFTSGPGIAPADPEGCSRSLRNFPNLLADKLGASSFVDASCGGATTKHLWQAQGANAPQLGQIGPDTTLVTFGTIGGNDIGLVQLAASCFSMNCVPPVGTDPLEAKFTALRTALTDGIRGAASAAPAAQIVVVGYGTYLPPGGCPQTFLGALTVEEFAYVQGQIDRLSDLLADVAAEQGVDFVDMRDIPGAVDHTACAEPTEQWIRALETYGDGANLHPSACGMDAMAQHLHRRILELRGQVDGLPEFDDSCVSAGPAPSPSPTPTPTTPPATTPAAPVESAAAAVRRELLAQAAGLRLTASCRPGKAGRKLVLRVGGRAPEADLVRFAVGSRGVGVDRTTPMRVSRPVGTRAWRGKVVAKVKMARGAVSAWHRIERPRPRCLR